MHVARLVAITLLVLGGAACGDDDPELSTSGGEESEPAPGATVRLSLAGAATDAEIDSTIAVIRRRLDAAGVEEATVVRRADEVVVELPEGTGDPAGLAELISETGDLVFRPVLAVIPPDVEPCPPGATSNADSPLPEVDADDNTLLCHQLGPTGLAGDAVVDARAERGGAGEWSVVVEISAEGLDAFNDLAAACFERTDVCPAGQLAIVLDGVVRSAPSIQQPSFEADGVVITGQLDEQEVNDLALVLRHGALPVPVTVVEVEPPR